jgi:hypothetical protein
LLALQPVPVEFRFIRVWTRPSGCAARKTCEQHHFGKYEQGPHWMLLYRRVAFSLRFPDGACRLVASGRSMFHHRVVRAVDYIL